MCFPTWMSTAMPIRVSSPLTSHSSFWRCAFTKSPSSSMVVSSILIIVLCLRSCRQCLFDVNLLDAAVGVSLAALLSPTTTPFSPLYVCIIHQVFSFLFRCSFTQWLGYCVPISDTRIYKGVRGYLGLAEDIEWVRRLKGYKFIHCWRRESDANGINTRTDANVSAQANNEQQQQKKHAGESTAPRTL